MNCKLLLFVLLAVVPVCAAAQNGTIRGSVSTADADKLAGVTVVVDGTTTGAVTDAQGQYTLKASPGNTLVFSYLGFKTLRATVRGEVLDVVMEPDMTRVDEVVVVGYGTQRKVDLTGSVATVKGDDLLKAPTPNLTNALAGKMTGVITTQQSGKPGLDDPTFIIRGKSTFGDNGTLMLVDGIERSIGKLDPNEIESVTVLKDAASAAIYGIRAANGVVLVTTKRGAEGRARVSYSGTVGIQQPTVVPEMMNAYQYARYLNLAMANAGSVPRFSEREIEAFRTGEQPSTNWWNETFRRNSLMHQHSLTLRGGTDRVKYFASGGVLSQDGLYDKSGFSRYNVRSNIDAKVTRDLSISLDLSGRFEQIGEAAAGDYLFSTVVSAKPTERPYVPGSVESGALQSSGQNLSPLGLSEHGGYHRVENSVFQGTLQGVYAAPFAPGLKLSGRFSYDRWFSNDKSFSTPYEFYTYDRDLDLYTKRKSGGGIDLYEGTAEDQRITTQVVVTYDRTFGGAHNLSALLLYEGSSYKYRNLQASRINFISNAIDQIYAGPDKDKGNGGSANETALKGYGARLNYNYKDRYLVQANVRIDGSYNFPNGKRWGVFPAVSVGWRISEEAFVKQANVFHNLKLRASYGEFGNDRIGQFQYLSGFKFASGAVVNGNYMSGISEYVLPNPHVTWEKARNFDVGLDFGFLGGKLSGEVTYFYKKTRDILMSRAAAVPESFGANLPDENIGKVDNQGVEAMLRYAQKFGHFGLLIEGNLTFARSKVVYMAEPESVESRIRRTGRPLDQFFGLKALGLFQSREQIDGWSIQDGNDNSTIMPGDIKYHDYDHNGVIDGNDIQRIGRSQIPELVYGLNLGFSWKGIDLTMNWQGASRFDQYTMWDPFNLESNALSVYMDSWHEGNRQAAYPRLYAGANQNNREKSSFWLYDGRYLRLRNLELSYTFPKMGFLRKVGVQGLRVFFSGNNLLTFSKMKHIDPEAPSIHPDNNGYYYPQMKSYNFGLNIEF